MKKKFLQTLCLALVISGCLVAQPLIAAWPFSSGKKPLTASSAPHTNVSIRFVGATKFTDAQMRVALADTISDIRESGLTPAFADDAAFFLGLFYRQHGYSQSEVAWKIVGNEIVLTIREGPLTTVGTITVSGNRLVPTETLRNFLLAPTRERFPKAKDNAIPFVQSDIEGAVNTIDSYYKSEGFLDSVISRPVIEFSPDKTRVSIRLAIREGTQYQFGKISYSGDLVFHGNADLQKQLQPFVTKPYTPQRVIDMERSVLYFYKSRGYFNADISEKSDPLTAKNGRVPVEFIIHSGEVFHFQGISVSGLDRLRLSFLKARFKKLNGQPYNPEALDKVYRELIGTGLFKTLRINPKAISTNAVRLDLNLEEEKPKEVGFSGGYGTYDGFLAGLHWADRDFFGFGRPLTLNFQISQRGQQVEALYTDPWLLNTDNQLRLRFYELTQDNSGYSKEETGFRAELNRKIATHLTLGGFYLGRIENITGNGIAANIIGKTHYLVSDIGLTAALDYRDNILNPHKGWNINATADYTSAALGSNLNYFRTTLSLSYFIPITKKSVLAFGARGGILLPMNTTDDILPIDERFFNGGARSVRSFAERNLGPQNEGHPIGGNAFTVFNVEYDFPIVGELGGALFTDAGSIGAYNGRTVGLMRYGVGAGIRYTLPIGLLRLDYGYNPDRRAGEDLGAFHLSFGFAF